MPHIIVGTAGHIDHGKTSLVRALTGIDTDRLKEEKERGITIDLGFASLAVDAETTLGFVDVPGHERFIKNMLAGAGGIDVVLLVVAADESVMPQTREHLDICSLLHVSRGLTVLTKTDVADPELVDLAEVEVHELVKGTFLEGAPVLRVSSQTGDGIPQVVDALRAVIATAPQRDPGRVVRLPIDRCFTMRGFGTVVSGTLIAGTLRRDEEVEILPRGARTRVRGLQVHGRPVDEARAGQRTAVNLQRVDLADVERGMVLTAPGAFTPTTAFDVHLELLPSAPAIERRKRVRFHTGTAEVMGHVILLGQDALEPGGRAFAQIRLETPTFALPGDRFIVRQYSPMVTLGGGEILDPHPSRHRRADTALPGRLARFKDAPPGDRVLMLVEERGAQTADVATVTARLGLKPGEAEAQMRSLARTGRLQIVAESPLVVASNEALRAAADAVLAEVTRFHAHEPLLKGIGREDLKGRVLRRAPMTLFRAVIDRLAAERRLALDQDLVHLFGRTVTLEGEEARVRRALGDRYRTLGLQAPAPDDVIAELGLNLPLARRILQLMVKEHELVRVSEDLTVERDAITRLIQDVRSMKDTTGSFGVKEFKDLTGLSRKFAVPLLEFLDSQRVTRRVGDARIIL